MITKRLFGTLVSSAWLVSGALHAASVSSEWNLFTPGSHLWQEDAYWTSSVWSAGAWAPTTATAPQNGTDVFAAYIRNAGGNAVVVETSGPVTVGKLWLERTGAGSTTLKLGGDLTVTGALPGPPSSGADARPTGFNNTTADAPGGLVIDLNGHTLNAGAVTDSALQTSRNYTLRDTSTLGNGTFTISSVSNATGHVTGTVQVENNVTVKVANFGGLGFQDGTGSSTAPGWMFAENATLWLAGNGSGSAVNMNVGGSIFGNVIVGSEGNSTAAVYALGHSSGNNVTIMGDLTLHGGSAITMSNSSGTAVKRMIRLSGNLTDESTTGVSYGGRTDTSDSGLFFVGGASKVQEVLVKRTGLTSRISIGDTDAIQGNIHLQHSLVTTGPIAVWNESRVDVDSFTLEGGSISIASDARLAFTFGEGIDDARIRATGTLSLGLFDLELTYNDEGWTDGDNLLLFEYGTLTGTPLLGTVTLNGFTHGDLWNDGVGGIWLMDVTAVPEPGALAAFLLGGAVFLSARVRRNRLRAVED